MKRARMGHKCENMLNALGGDQTLKWTTLAVFVVCLGLTGLNAGPLQAAPAPPEAEGLLNNASLTFSPSAVIIQGCVTVPVEVRVDDVTDLYGVDVKMAFDPDVLEVVDADLARPGIQVQGGSFISPDFVVSREADNTAGKLEYTMTQVNPSLPVSGSGVLFTILFRAKSAAAASALVFTQTDLVDMDGLLLAVTVVDGSATTVVPAAPILGILKLNATDVQLSWTASSGVATYQLHRNTAPYFVPVPPAYRVMGGLSTDDLGALGNPAANNYYVVQSVCASGFSSQPSNRVGEFDYALVRGVSSIEPVDGRLKVNPSEPA